MTAQIDATKFESAASLFRHRLESTRAQMAACERRINQYVHDGKIDMSRAADALLSESTRYLELKAQAALLQEMVDGINYVTEATDA